MKEKKLTNEEFLELEMNHLKSDLLIKEMAILELRKELLQVNKALLVYVNQDYDRNIEECKNANQSLNKVAEKNKKDRENTIKKITKKYKIKGGFGYNSDTLIIKQTEK